MLSLYHHKRKKYCLYLTWLWWNWIDAGILTQNKCYKVLSLIITPFLQQPFRDRKYPYVLTENLSFFNPFLQVHLAGLSVVRRNLNIFLYRSDNVIHVQLRFALLFRRHKKMFFEEYWPLLGNRMIWKRVEMNLTRIFTKFVLELNRKTFETSILSEESVCFCHIVMIVQLRIKSTFRRINGIII
jgi:hypothetical protein